MNNDALVAALGEDTGPAIRGYRLQVVSAAARSGLLVLSSDSPPRFTVEGPGRLADPIRLCVAAFGTSDRAGPGVRMMRWGPAHGWSLSAPRSGSPVYYLAGPDAAPVDLVPTAPDAVALASGVLTGSVAASLVCPVGVELDDDPETIQRLLGFADWYRAMRDEHSAGTMPRGTAVRARTSLRPGRALRRSVPDLDAGTAPCLRPTTATATGAI